MKFAYFLTILVILCIIGMGISMQLKESFMGNGPAGGRGNPSPTRHMDELHDGPGEWFAYSQESKEGGKSSCSGGWM
jgi:hypothetical protein